MLRYLAIVLAGCSLSGCTFAAQHRKNPLKLEHVLQPVDQEIDSISFSPDHKLLATAGSEGILTIYSLKDFKVVRQHRFQNQSINFVRFVDGSRLLLALEASTRDEAVLSLYDLQRDKALETVYHDDNHFKITAMGENEGNSIFCADEKFQLLRYSWPKLVIDVRTDLKPIPDWAVQVSRIGTINKLGLVICSVRPQGTEFGPGKIFVLNQSSLKQLGTVDSDQNVTDMATDAAGVTWCVSSTGELDQLRKDRAFILAKVVPAPESIVPWDYRICALGDCVFVVGHTIRQLAPSKSELNEVLNLESEPKSIAYDPVLKTIAIEQDGAVQLWSLRSR